APNPPVGRTRAPFRAPPRTDRGRTARSPRAARRERAGTGRSGRGPPPAPPRARVPPKRAHRQPPAARGDRRKGPAPRAEGHASIAPFASSGLLTRAKWGYALGPLEVGGGQPTWSADDRQNLSILVRGTGRFGGPRVGGAARGGGHRPRRRSLPDRQGH